jgi:hypothetical protein
LRIEIRPGAAASGFGGVKQNDMFAAFGKLAGSRQARQAGADHLDTHGR